jgi:hypothetical protein
MRNIIFLACLLLGFSLRAQAPFEVSFDTLTVPNAPGLHSYAAAIHNGLWLIVAGRTDGLHPRQPFAAFFIDDNNRVVYVIDPANRQVWQRDLSELPDSIYNQLQSTNMQFHQDGETLYCIGGYGDSFAAGFHTTYPKLAAINVPGMIAAIQNNTPVGPYVKQMLDQRLAVCGGNLGKIGDFYYLVGGHRFDGRYNPMGPNHGPGFFQEYTNEVRRFRILDTPNGLSIADYSAWRDTAELHRRDYNLVPQIFPDGSFGYTAFSGVFQYNRNIPWLNTVNISETAYTPVPNFNQYLSQYHSAKLPVFDSVSNDMHNVFFGGMSRYSMDANGLMLDDTLVPFVNTVSRVSRAADGTLAEVKMPVEMPGLLGSSAEFFPADPAYFDAHGILQLHRLPAARTLVGYIFGGIQSQVPNSFFSDPTSTTQASNGILEVFVNTAATGMQEAAVDGPGAIRLRLMPNPARETVRLEFQQPVAGNIAISINDALGRTVQAFDGDQQEGHYFLDLDVRDLPRGTYFVRLGIGHFSDTQVLVLE